MANFVSGLLAIGLVLGFLAFYAVGIHSLPFTIIVVAVGAIIVAEFLESLREVRHRNGQ